MMTIVQEEQIRVLRSQGMGYRQIGNQLNLSRDAVRNYCRSNKLNGYQKAVQIMMTDDNVCSNCGELLVQPKTGRKRRFCCEACRRIWWGQNRDKVRKSPEAIYGFTCKRCGKEFTAYGNPHRKYCSHKCFISDRYWGGEEPAKVTEIKGIQNILYSAKGHV